MADVSHRNASGFSADPAAQGTVYYADASGNVAELPPGTAGHVLTTGGAGANPEWASAGVGGGGGGDSLGIVNVTDDAFGAVGDGATDDRAAIELAITYAIANSVKTIYFPPGTYMVSKQVPGVNGSTADLRCGILLEGVSGLNFVGSGRSTVIKMLHDGSDGGNFAESWRGMFRLTKGTSDIGFFNMVMDGGWSGETGDEFIYLVEANSVGNSLAQVAAGTGTSATATLTSGSASSFTVGQTYDIWDNRLSGNNYTVDNPVGEPRRFPTGIITFTGQPVNNDTITIGSTVYRFRTVLSTSYDVLIGASTADTVTNLIRCINDSGTEGTHYGDPTLVATTSMHQHVSATQGTGTTVLIAAFSNAGPYNEATNVNESVITVSEAATNVTWNVDVLEGGPYTVVSRDTGAGTVTFDRFVSHLVEASDHLALANQNVSRITFRDVHFRNNRAEGIHLQGESVHKVEFVYIDKCSFINCKRATVVFQRNTRNCVVRDCYMESVTDSVIDAETSNSGNAAPPTGIVIDSCHIRRLYGSPARAISFVGLAGRYNNNADHVTISNCQIENGSIQLFKCSNGRITNNRITNRNDAGGSTPTVEIKECNGVVVDNNVIYRNSNSAAGSCVGVTSDGSPCDGVVVTKNHCYQQTASEIIQVQHASNSVVSNNICYYDTTTTATNHGILLQANLTGPTISSINTGNEQITTSGNHGLQTGEGPVQVFMAAGGVAYPTGLATDVNYWPIKVSDTVLQLAVSRTAAFAGTAIDISSSGTGTFTIQKVADNNVISGNVVLGAYGGGYLLRGVKVQASVGPMGRVVVSNNVGTGTDYAVEFVGSGTGQFHKQPVCFGNNIQYITAAVRIGPGDGLQSASSERGGFKVFANHGTAASDGDPNDFVTGNLGDEYLRSNGAEGRTKYICTTAGTPGTVVWKSYGLSTGTLYGCKLSWTSVTQVGIAVGRVRDSTDTIDIINTATKTVAITSSGANGLDTGAEANSTWYAVHLIKRDDGNAATAGLLSLSSTAPTLPANYTNFRHIGWVYNDSGGNLRRFRQVGDGRVRTIWLDETQANLRALNAGASTTFAGVSCVTFAPTSATALHLGYELIQAATGGAASDTLLLRPTGGNSSDGPWAFKGNVAVDAVATRGQCLVPCNTAQSVDYLVSDAQDAASLYVLGYVEELV